MTKIKFSSPQVKIDSDSTEGVSFHNPPKAFLLQLKKSQPQTLYYDEMPSQPLINALAETEWTINVPSLAYRAYFRRLGVTAEIDKPVIQSLTGWTEKRNQVKKALRLGGKTVIYVDDRLIEPSSRSIIQQAIRKWKSLPSPLAFIQVQKQKGRSMPPTFFSFSYTEADKKKIWSSADWIITLQNQKRSLSSIHRQALSLGIPVISREGGDHDEWVLHRHTGLLLSKITNNKEVNQYLQEIATTKYLTKQTAYNGQKIVGEHYVTSESQLNHSGV